MSEDNFTMKPRKFHHLTQIQRGEIQAMLKMKLPKSKIVREVQLSLINVV